ncbi:MAG: efflux RND transporter permease subunit [Chloroherpetonaceae bacterium]|nr:efflux RND transporter permease subunit [Chthonomonadaceae bacterium]MDW8206426.1 efflux RND transporter permease subunit [Chloroherpetonaceae bacterium]
MQKLAEVCVRRPVFATVLILSLVVIGAFSYFRLGVDRFPKVDFPIVTVVVRQPGASPEEIETELVDRIEEAVNTISGLDQLSSTSYEGLGLVVATFQLEKDINIAAQEVRDKVNLILPELPAGIEAPVVDKVDPDAAPILEIAVSSPGSIRDTTEYVDRVIRRRIEGINGVGQVRIIGGRARQINIWLDPQRLRAVGLSALDVQRAVQAQNIQIPGGRVDQNTRELTLRTYGRVQRVEDFGEILLRRTPGGAVVRLKDVATIEDGMEEPETIASLNGQPTVLLSIRKQSGLNTVATVHAVKERLQEIQKALPPGYTLTITRDQSEYIEAATHAVQEHLIVGSILAALVVLLFLWNWRTTVISAIAIPASIIATFGLMSWMNFTLNALTLLALTLSVGIVIDDAIVVLENVYRFIEEKHMNPFEAAIEGTREIGLAVMATTLSLIAVFLPIAFMSGVVGRFMNSFGLTMSFAIGVSLLVSFTLTPMMASRWIRRPATEGAVPHTPEGIPIGMEEASEEASESAHAHTTRQRHSVASKERGLFRVIDVVYTAMLRWSLRHRWAVVLISVLVLFSTIPIGMKVNKNFLPEDDESQFQITVRAPEGTSLTATQELGERIAAEARRLKGVAYTVLTIGNNEQRTPNLATIFVKLVDVSQRPGISQQDLMQQARSEILPKFGKLRASVSIVPAFSSAAGAPNSLSYYIAGPDLKKLEQYARQAMEQLKQFPGVVDVDSSLITGLPELGVRIDRQRAADLGVAVSDIASTLRLLVGGVKVTDYSEGGEQYETHIRAPLTARSDPAAIGQITVPSATIPGGVPLSSLVTFTTGTGPSQIVRLGRQRQVNITANVLPGYSQTAAQQEMARILDRLQMEPGYTHGVSGNSREQVKAFSLFLSAFLLSIVFMYLILAAQFESWLHPVTILLSLPLTVPFALLSILITGVSLNIFSMLGILVLFGVVKKNSILQVDHTNQLRARGMNRYDAIVQASRDRLRPILMTTVAFVAGMVPLVVSSGTGAASNRNIGFTVIGGQSLVLLLTLLATPVFYSLFDDIVTTPYWGTLRRGLQRLFRRRAQS